MFGFTMLLFASAAVAAGMGATIGAALDALLDGLRYLLAACAAPMAAWGFYCHWRGQPRYPLTGVFFLMGLAGWSALMPTLGQLPITL